jgi:regulatory protein
VTSATKPRKQQKPSEKQLSLSSSTLGITALEPVSRNQRQVAIYLAELPWGTTAKEIIRELKLAVGQKHQPGQLGRRIEEAEQRLAMGLALRLLSYRGRSRREVVEKLSWRGVSAESVDRVVRKLEQAGYLNDEAFVKAWVRERTQVRGFGRYRIKNELLAKGIDPVEINTELGEAYTEDQEKAVALALAQARLSRYAGLDPMVARRRLAQVLLRRGFNSVMAQNIVAELLPSTGL